MARRSLMASGMNASRFVFATLLAASVTACVDPGDVEELSETTNELSTSSWTSSWRGMVSHPPAVALLDGFEYYVYSGDPRLDDANELFWHQCSPTACTDKKKIPGQLSMGRPSVAAYNGYIYMVHQGDTDDTAVWFTRLDVTTGIWMQNIKLPVTTLGGPPALTVFNGRLYMAGSREAQVLRNGVEVTTYPLWYTSMGTDEQWAPARNITGRESASPPSLAVLGSTMYMAHRDGATGEIVMQKMSVGTGWSAPTKIAAGPYGSYIQGNDVQIAAVNGYLHLVHRRFDSDYTYWTYNRGCDAFAPEVTIDAHSSHWQSSMQVGRTGLVLHRYYLYTDALNWYVSRFNAPPAPITAPNCGAI